jgi:6-pyruvoyltetrahydropterin/6-carboxytetrahydropterin synthase
MGFKVNVNNSSIKFSACHFLKEPKKCSRLHGHNYYVSVEINGDLDDNNFVIDFIALREKLEEIVKPLDHYVLIPSESKDIEIIEDQDSFEILSCGKRYVFPRCDVKLLPLGATTSELLAKYIHDKLKEFYARKKISVKIEESRGNIASYSD